MSEPTAEDIAQALTVAPPAVVRLVADLLAQLGLLRTPPTARRPRAKHVPAPPSIAHLSPEKLARIKADAARHGVG